AAKPARIGAGDFVENDPRRFPLERRVAVDVAAQLGTDDVRRVVENGAFAADVEAVVLVAGHAAGGRPVDVDDRDAVAALLDAWCMRAARRADDALRPQ